MIYVYSLYILNVTSFYFWNITLRSFFLVHEGKHLYGLANNQLDAQFFYFIIRLLQSLYMFRATSCSLSGGQIVLIQHLVSSLSVSGRPVHSTGRLLNLLKFSLCCFLYT